MTAAVILSLNESGVINLFRLNDTDEFTETVPDLADLAEPDGPPVDTPEDVSDDESGQAAENGDGQSGGGDVK